MKAVVLVGGLGTRLRPLTWNTPKSLVPVLNRPFLEHVLLRLKGHGINEIVLALSHLAPAVEACFGDGGRLGMSVNYAHEKRALGTAGAVKNAANLVSDSFFVLNGDIFTDLDYTAMLKFHKARKARATIALTPVEDPTQYGLIETRRDGGIKRFLEKPKVEEITTNMINAGTYILEPEVLDSIPAAHEYSFERQLFPGMLAKGEAVFAFPSAGYWIDIGNPDKYKQLNFDLLAGNSGHYGFEKGHEIKVGAGCVIHPSAHLKGSLLVGEGCVVEEGAVVTGPAVISSDCRIESGAHIERSVIWNKVTIGEGCNVTDSAIANDCLVGAGSILEGAVLGDNVTISRGCNLAHGQRVEPGKTLA
jgi:mannose-1-phosphate guanylyltransferase